MAEEKVLSMKATVREILKCIISIKIKATPLMKIYEILKQKQDIVLTSDLPQTI